MVPVNPFSSGTPIVSVPKEHPLRFCLPLRLLGNKTIMNGRITKPWTIQLHAGETQKSSFLEFQQEKRQARSEGRVPMERLQGMSNTKLVLNSCWKLEITAPAIVTLAILPLKEMSTNRNIEERASGPTAGSRRQLKEDGRLIGPYRQATSAYFSDHLPLSLELFFLFFLRCLESILSLSSLIRSFMGELAETQVCTTGTFHVWRTLLDWFSFLFQIFLQLFRGPPSFGRILAFFGLRQSLLCSPSYLPFKPLPVDVQSDDAPPSDLPQDRPIDRLTVVLDLDETLVCAYETSSLSASVRDQATESGLKWFELECVLVDKDVEGRPRVNHITVFERPGLHEFLARTSEFVELVLFTAGLEGYARPLVDRIDVNNRISLRLYRPATISTKYREHVKDLTCLSKDLARTVIIDNNPFSFILQPLNGIPCVPFSAGQPEDKQLIQVILPLLQQLAVQKDVRPLLYEQYHMPEWFQKHGIPTSPV